SRSRSKRKGPRARRAVTPSRSRTRERRGGGVAMSSEFHDPPWDAPLDVEAAIAAIPYDAKIKGLFIVPMLAEARKRGLALKWARDRYQPFFDYPLDEYARLLVEIAQGLFPDLPLRKGLRKIGRAAQKVLVDTIIGRVVWASVESLGDGLESV